MERDKPVIIIQHKEIKRMADVKLKINIEAEDAEAFKRAHDEIRADVAQNPLSPGEHREYSGQGFTATATGDPQNPGN